MMDFAPLATGLAGFVAGVAYANRSWRWHLVQIAMARAIVIGSRAYLLAPLHADPAPAPKPGASLVAIDGGKSGDAA